LPWLEKTRILKGTVRHGAIQFDADKELVTDKAGCVVTSLTLTPFGGNEFMAQWRDGDCGRGNMILKKSR
jgi:hypothetical protein